MRVAIVGSRDFSDLSRINRYIKGLPPTTIVVSGGAKGVDQYAIDYAQAQGFCTEVFEADWDTHGKKAGMLRNGEMLSTVDAVIAFWDGKSRGTKHAIDYALKSKHIERLTVVKEINHENPDASDD